MPSETLHLRLPADMREKLELLSAATNRPRTFHVNAALERYLDDELWQIAHIRKGIEDLDAGRFASHEDVMAGGRKLIADARARKTSST
jgi:RHH-type rel operon transcriptional repressor/antitoxin RelB